MEGQQKMPEESGMHPRVIILQKWGSADSSKLGNYIYIYKRWCVTSTISGVITTFSHGGHRFFQGAHINVA